MPVAPRSSDSLHFARCQLLVPWTPYGPAHCSAQPSPFPPNTEGLPGSSREALSCRDISVLLSYIRPAELALKEIEVVMIALRNHFRAYFEDNVEHWRGALPHQWARFLVDCPSPNIDEIPAHVEVDDRCVIYPSFRPGTYPDARPDAHLMRALEGLDPEAVTVLVLGQDPYLQVAQATGRSFEDGQWRNGQDAPQAMASAQKRLYTAAWSTQDGMQGYFIKGGWPRFVRERHNMPGSRVFFDQAAANGVLFLNAAWTRTTTAQVKYHLRVWAPAVHGIIARLVDRPVTPLVICSFGDPALQTVQQSGFARRAEAEPARFRHIHNTHISWMRLVPDENFLRLSAEFLVGRHAPIWWPVNDP